MARFIAIEGPDKVGKATQSKRLALYLEARGVKVVRVEIPFHDGITYRIIYWMLRNGQAVRFPNLFQVAHFLNKVIYQAILMPWHWFTVDYVVLDRWKLSSVVYGSAGKANSKWIRFLYDLLMAVDHTIILMGEAFRSDRPDDSYESHKKMQQDVRIGYVEAANASPADHTVVNVVPNDNREDVHRRVLKVLIDKGVV